jgi:hypothetical protein
MQKRICGSPERKCELRRTERQRYKRDEETYGSPDQTATEAEQSAREQTVLLLQLPCAFIRLINIVRTFPIETERATNHLRWEFRWFARGRSLQRRGRTVKKDSRTGQVVLSGSRLLRLWPIETVPGWNGSSAQTWTWAASPTTER